MGTMTDGLRCECRRPFAGLSSGSH
jgi:hypothetical protein